MRTPTRETWKRHEADIKLALNDIIKDGDALLSSSEFVSKFGRYIIDIALYERDRKSKHKKQRSLSYANIGILDENDLIQEAYLCFLEAYKNLDLNHEKVVEAPDIEKGAVVWGFIKGSTIGRFNRRLRELKDGVKVPEREMFIREDSPNKTKNNATNFFTKNFSQLDKVFFSNQEQAALTRIEIDLIGLFLEVQMDKYLDRNFKGDVKPKGIERQVIRRLFGIDTPEESYADLAEYYGISQSTLRTKKQEALAKLRKEQCKLEIAEYAYGYKMQFATWFDKNEKRMVTPGIYEWLKDYYKKNEKKDELSRQTVETAVYNK